MLETPMKWLSSLVHDQTRVHYLILLVHFEVSNASSIEDVALSTVPPSSPVLLIQLIGLIHLRWKQHRQQPKSPMGWFSVASLGNIGSEEAKTDMQVASAIWWDCRASAHLRPLRPIQFAPLDPVGATLWKNMVPIYIINIPYYPKVEPCFYLYYVIKYVNNPPTNHYSIIPKSARTGGARGVIIRMA